MTLKDTMVLNGKEYKIPEITFDAVCRLEELGADITLKSKQLNTLRAFVGLVTDNPGKEINDHIVNGGTLETIAEAFLKAVEKSDFFQVPGKVTDDKTTSE